MVLTWIGIGFCSPTEIENAVIAMALAAIGIQTIFTAIFLSVLLQNEGN